MSTDSPSRLALRALTRPTLLLYALPWLMLLLALGTISQRYIGLYPSQKLFFGSFILWLGPVPLPGAYTVLTLIALSLLAKLAFYSPLNKRDLGIIITHVSIVVLLIGGLVGALDRQEGYVLLQPGERASFVSDYHDRELAVLKNGRPYRVIPAADWAQGKPIEGLSFSVRMTRICYPCMAVPRKIKVPNLHGLAQYVDLAPEPLSTEDEKNQPGLILEVRGSGDAQDGTYIAFEHLAREPAVKQGSDTYTMSLRAERHALPFTITLRHFIKEDYPGTDMARAYRSEVTVSDENGAWNAAIEMNQPLRYRGYTLYQSSFGSNEEGDYTVLAVVKNAGAWFPYLSIATLCFGLLLHLCIRLRGDDA